jgi:sugar/nucleoside kinase (ribokinase family)
MNDEVIVAGHLCVDVIPLIESRGAASLPRPGELIEVGPALITTGGAVSNTGLALHRLGVPVRLAARLGDDAFGRLARMTLAGLSESLVRSLVTVPGETTSYSIVLGTPGQDRSFLHCPGANQTFSAADLTDSALRGARVLHVGYPPLMARLYEDGGRGLAAAFARAHELGVATSLDFAMPDPGSAAAHIPWDAWLATVLPHVDFFLPSLDEMLLLTRRARYLELVAQASSPLASRVAMSEVSALAERLLAHGALAVGLKLGERGLYLRTAGATRLASAQAHGHLERSWADRELLQPCFMPRAVASTTGAGDATIAGFLAGVIARAGPEETLRLACAVGAASVEAADAWSGVSSLASIRERLASGWIVQREPLGEGFRFDAAARLWQGPSDRR